MTRGLIPSRLALRLSLAGAAAVSVAAPAVAQRAVTLSVQERPAYARIVAKWADGNDTAPAVTASVDNSVLIVRFDQAVAVNVEALQAGLPSWAAAVRMDADGKGARIALTRDARVRTSASADLAAIDISGADSPSFPPAIVSPLIAQRQRAAAAAQVAAAPPPAPLEDIEVRGSHQGASSRIAVYWPRPTTFRVTEQRPGFAKILFSRRANADLAYIRIEPPPNLASFNAENTNQGWLVTVTSKDEIPIRVWSDDGTPTIDISRADPEIARQAQEVADAASRPRTPPPVRQTPRVGDVTSPPPRGSTGLVNAAPPPSHAEAGRPILLTPPNVAAPGPAAAAPPAPAAAVLGGLDHATVMSPSWRDPAPSNRVIDVKVLPLPAGVELQVPFAAPAPAAVFTRGNAVWAVFGANADLRVPQTALPAGYRVRAMRVPNATIFRLEIPRGLTVSADASESTWVIRIAPTATRPARFLRPTRRAGDNGRMRIETMLTGAAGLVWFDDPVIGDKIAAAVAYGPSSASSTARDSVEALMMPTAHGLGIAPKSDSIQVTLEGELVAVSFADGGQLTPEAVVAAVPTAASNPAFIDFAHWGGKTGMAWYARRDELDYRASQADASTPDGSAALLELARFYVGHELAFEALGALQLARSARNDILFDQNFLGLRGAANVLARRYRAAEEDLSKGQLRNDPSAALWRGVAATQLGDWERAGDFFRDAEQQIYAYPPKWAGWFASYAAEAALHANDYDLARRRAEQAIDTGEGEAQDRGRLVLANLAAIVDGPAAAYPKFLEISLHAAEPIAVRAELRRLELGVDAGKMTANDAANELETLRFRWRGDDIEMQTVGILADQYMRVGRFREALMLAKSAALRDANAPGARDLRIKLTEYFSRLFLTGEADRLDPIQAVALFYEFKDLLPIGQDGDQMVRKLAQRLVAYDLLEPATELLQYQVDNRLRGVGKAAIAVDLAAIYLRDRRPDRALAAISNSREPQLPRDLVLTRRLMEAAAYRDLGRYDNVVELVEQVPGLEAKSLLADAYWRDHKWVEAARIYSEMLALTNDATPRRSDIALKAAIAARMAPDAAMLAELRRRWMPLFENDPNKPSFDLITASVDVSGAAVTEAVRRLADAPRVDAFEAAMRARLAPAAARPAGTVPGASAAAAPAPAAPASGSR
jgi:hypothetical protein